MEINDLRETIFDVIRRPTAAKIMQIYTTIFFWSIDNPGAIDDIRLLFLQCQNFSMTVRGDPKRFVSFMFSRSLRNTIIPTTYGAVCFVQRRISYLITTLLRLQSPFLRLQAQHLAAIFIRSIAHTATIFYFSTLRHHEDVSLQISNHCKKICGQLIS